VVTGGRIVRYCFSLHALNYETPPSYHDFPMIRPPLFQKTNKSVQNHTFIRLFMPSFRELLMPYLTIVQADLVSLFKSRLTYGWLIAGIFLEVITVLTASIITPTSAVITQGLSFFIYIWSMLMISVTASTVSSESGELAESILSKSVKRHDYILAKFSARIMYVLTIYLAIIAVLVVGAVRLSDEDYELYGLIISILLVALALIMLTTLGVTLSTFISNSVISIVSLLIVWYAMTFFFPILDLELLSPGNILIVLPDIIQGTWTNDEWITTTSFVLISFASIAFTTIYFSTSDL
jgi:hypothetical protein